MVRRRLGLRFLLAVATLLVLAFATGPWWLPRLGYALIHDDGPARADIAVVLAGDSWGYRIEKGAELVKAGYVPAVLVSGPPMYSTHECDLAIDMMVRKGYPASWFVPFPNESLSTREEATLVLAELRRRLVRSFLLVTSSYHTARAGRGYRALERRVGGPPFRVVAAPDKYFRPDSWWRVRQAQKIALFEWMKTVSEALGK